MHLKRNHHDSKVVGRQVADTLREIADHLAAIRDSQLNGAREWLTIEDVANELQVSKDTVERLIAGSSLRVAILRTSKGRGRRQRYRIRREWLSDFLLNNARSPQGAKLTRRQAGLKAIPDFIG